ncbi:adenylyl-sulfate kinase [Chitinophaga sancti]|uniref:Adenylyl-sulfate kinase n=1 Tax=Chitinophaga sancti TaxID=1004 RepID=A0A1K1NEX0_9BACT|nr:adenylyl-sulfate kinase [Chitinophaga sancti]WQD63267.1 adenylyl-sulfate kinase [Chitinophaga sancti]WQG91107.1 adenylyl-sulfate kinase [Chitinophaga sancti]SFW33883.1 adenylylsulfate kinase [Chitinophaga sancti]
MIIQLCGLSGAGKTTIATSVKRKAMAYGTPVEIIDGDKYREFLCKDLGFSKADRCENIRRLGFVASRLSGHGIVCIISAINPYSAMRDELTNAYEHVKTVFVDCPVAELVQRDTKGLYKRALLPDSHPDKLRNLTGVNDPFEAPQAPDLHLKTNEKTVAACTSELFQFIQESIQTQATRLQTA